LPLRPTRHTTTELTDAEITAAVESLSNNPEPIPSAAADRGLEPVFGGMVLVDVQLLPTNFVPNYEQRPIIERAREAVLKKVEAMNSGNFSPPTDPKHEFIHGGPGAGPRKPEGAAGTARPRGSGGSGKRPRPFGALTKLRRFCSRT
jgi:hypothetical protein